MSFYLDTNVLVSFFTADNFSERAEAFLTANRSGPFFLSDLAAAEFSAVIARQVRIRGRSQGEGIMVFAEFDVWRGEVANEVSLSSEHIVLAEKYLRRFDLALTASDAMHIAITQRLRATLVTFDRQMGTAARALGVAIAEA